MTTKYNQFTKDNTPEGIIRLPARTVDLSQTRGIKFDRPTCFAVNTPVGQIEIVHGDWVVTCLTGSQYVLREADYNCMDEFYV